MRRIRPMLVAGAAILISAVLAGGWLSLQDGAAANPKTVIYMSAVEYKGSTNSEPFPSAAPPPGGGYILKPPDENGKWETSTYRWEPGTIMVKQDDEVELWIWGVNGAQHPSYIENYVPQFTVTRGNLTVLNFKADKAGSFRIHCDAHQPSMEGQLVVLPKNAEAPSPAQATPPSAPTPAQLPASGGEAGGGDSSWTFVGGFLAVLAAAGVLYVLLQRWAAR